MMKPIIRYSLFTFIAYLVFLLATIPASQTYALAKARINLPVSLYQVSGTLWSGQAKSIQINDLQIETVSWSIHPLQLLLGRIEATLSTDNTQMAGEVTLGTTLLGNHYLQSNNFSLPVSTVQNQLPKTPVALAGELQIHRLEARINEQGIQSIESELQWRKAAIGSNSDITIGDFALNLTTEDDIITGIMKDNGGPIQASGKLTLKRDGHYDIEMKLMVRDKTRNDLQVALRSLGRADASGQTIIRYKGALPIAELITSQTTANTNP